MHVYTANLIACWCIRAIPWKVKWCPLIMFLFTHNIWTKPKSSYLIVFAKRLIHSTVNFENNGYRVKFRYPITVLTINLFSTQKSVFTVGLQSRVFADTKVVLYILNSYVCLLAFFKLNTFFHRKTPGWLDFFFIFIVRSNFTQVKVPVQILIIT